MNMDSVTPAKTFLKSFIFICCASLFFCTACHIQTCCTPSCKLSFGHDNRYRTSMMDENITTNVQTRIAGDTGLLDQNIKVVTYERTVTLSGTVENPTQRLIAICLAKNVPHVKRVISKIQIRRYF